MYPIRFEPIYQDYVWGGDRIAREFHRKVSQSRIAESWELSDRDDAMSIVMNGPFKGKTLHQLVLEMGEELLGAGQKWDRFPLLLKIIDAKQNLSVQVHPDEMSAVTLNGQPKTEGWVMLDNGSVYAALKPDVDEKAFRKAIENGKADQLVEKHDLKKGDTVHIPAGRVHAICEGAFLYEVQQNSNTTYRLFDWGRKGRDLHLKEGFSAIHWGDQGHVKAPPHHISSDLHHQFVVLLSTPFFVIDRIDVFDTHHVPAIPKTFQVFFCLQGKGELIVDAHREPFELGMTYLIPASCKSINIEGKCEFLRIRLP
jgi:mannose-6-phosphate isomerase